MQPLRCSECQAQVLVQKNSWEHTEVQWSAEARSRCREFGSASGPGRRPGAPVITCSAMEASLTRAAAEGLVEVLDDAPVPGPILQ
ncbi:hypothetical protein [Rhodococcus phenolicus]|uniref:hypothetical protein n=1 Tax=Rhodococcus phenolicus TaxID=263849 RepID=UPI00083513A9|nr:hypothetical protein [Rhodococcus phenolicus]